MENKTILSNISVYSFTHALIDATCAAVVFAMFALNKLDLQTFAYFIILYNVLAFSLQSPFGLLVDKLRIPVHSAIIGILLTSASTIFLSIPLLAIFLAGIGNALFHVGGGVISLNLLPKKATMPGIYVAPGALGLLIGGLIGKGGYFIAWPFIILLLFSAYLIWNIKKPMINYETNFKGNFKWFEISILLLLLAIAIRGLAGMILVFPWKSNLYLLIILTLAIVLGKALGGFLGDKFGWMRVSLLGLIIAAPLLSFFTKNPYLAIIGLFCFNLAMPITLTAIANMLPGRAGFAFGLTTLALVIGAAPTFTSLKIILNNQLIILGIIIILILSVYIGLKLYFNHFHKKTIFIKNKA